MVINYFTSVKLESVGIMVSGVFAHLPFHSLADSPSGLFVSWMICQCTMDDSPPVNNWRRNGQK